MKWQFFKDLWGTPTAKVDPKTTSHLWPTLDDRQKIVYDEWQKLWEAKGSLAIMMELEQRIHELEKDKK